MRIGSLRLTATPVPRGLLFAVAGLAAALVAVELLELLGSALELGWLRDVGNNVPGGPAGTGAAGAGGGAAGSTGGRRQQLPRPDLPPDHPLNTGGGGAGGPLMPRTQPTGGTPNRYSPRQPYAGNPEPPGPKPAPPPARPGPDWAQLEENQREYSRQNPPPPSGPPPTAYDQAREAYDRGVDTVIEAVLTGGGRSPR